MTRDEAISKTRAAQLRAVPWMSPESAAMHVDVFVALGMLKLEEPKSATEKALDALRDAGWDSRVVNVLHRAGLKVVDVS